MYMSNKLSEYSEYWKQKIQKDKEQIDILQSEILSLVDKSAHMLKHEFDVKKVILFGSLLKKTRFHLKSDIDIAVLGLADEKYFKALNRLYDIFPKGIDIDLITLETIDIEFKNRILKKGAVIG